jgi:phosphoglucosamine mutase
MCGAMAETKFERRLFGTDGIRGVANQFPMTAEVALSLGRSVAEHFRQRDKRCRVVIGKDTRLSGYMFESALEAGIVSAGADVMLVGPLPTPAIAFITASMRADAGMVISASHNPFQDNGIKIFGPDGFKLADDIEAEIERRMTNPEPLTPGPEPRIGKAVRLDDAEGRYVQFIKNTFPRDRTLDGVRIVVDCANGAAYRAAPQVFEELGADVTALSVEPNGRNINDGCGALHPDKVAAEVRRTHASIGIALDGDADRVILTDERGDIVDGDQILAILGTRFIAQRKLVGNTVVATVMSNLGLERALAVNQGLLLRTAVGDRYVVEAMRAGGYAFGGEQSGHIVFLQESTTGDGLLAALQVLSVMVEEGRSLSDLAKLMTRYPQVLINFRVPRKVPVDNLPTVQAVIAKVEKALGKEGRVLVRYSGTETKARVMIEGADETVIRAYAEEIAEVMRKAVDAALAI